MDRIIADDQSRHHTLFSRDFWLHRLIEEAPNEVRELVVHRFIHENNTILRGLQVSEVQSRAFFIPCSSDFGRGTGFESYKTCLGMYLVPPFGGSFQGTCPFGDISQANVVLNRLLEVLLSLCLSHLDFSHFVRQERGVSMCFPLNLRGLIL